MRAGRKDAAMNPKRYLGLRPPAVYMLVVLAVLWMPDALRAASMGGPELDRPLVSTLGRYGLELWGQYDYFSPSLDVLNYLDKQSPGAARIDTQKTMLVGVKFALTDRLNASYGYQHLGQDISRSKEPKSIQNALNAHFARAQYIFYEGDGYDIAIEAGYNRHLARPLDFLRYDTGNVSVVSLNGQPVVSITGKDSAWIGALRGAYYLDDQWRVTLGFEARRVTVETRLDSSLIDDPVVGPSLKAERPQTTPWHENHLLLQLGLDWRVFRFLGLAAHYTHYEVRRNGYIPKAGKTDFNNNDQLDGYLFWHVTDDISVYGHGRLSRRFVLGDLPLSYNTRTNHRFKDPFGFVSFGAAWTF